MINNLLHLKPVPIDRNEHRLLRLKVPMADWSVAARLNAIFVAAAEFRKRDHDPRRRMRVLPAVLPHTGRISFDVPRILRRLVEWWIEQWQDLCASCDKSGPNGIHRPFGEPFRNGTREHSPRLRDRIDLALFVL